jgi:CyaY protein
MTESEFHLRADALMARLEAALDNAPDGIDHDRAEGVLTVEGPRGKLIVSRQAPNRELWLAARSGGFHFRADAQGWRDTRDGMPLASRLAALLSDLGAGPVTIEID